jgi:hypothetical protein
MTGEALTRKLKKSCDQTLVCSFGLYTGYDMADFRDQYGNRISERRGDYIFDSNGNRIYEICGDYIFDTCHRFCVAYPPGFPTLFP